MASTLTASATLSPPDVVQTVAVIGSGLMGSGIAQVFASIGKSTLLYDIDSANVERAIKNTRDRLLKSQEKGKISTEEMELTLSHLQPARSLQELRGAELYIEAIVERFDAKVELFQAIDQLACPEALYASNTSSISITRLASVVQRPHQVIGMHFMNPVPVMKLVEIIRGLQTDDRTYQITRSLVEALGKTAVTAQYDYPGFIVNRILVPMINEAIFALMEGLAAAEEIDTAMKLGTNQPMGPLELADFVGLDTCLAILRILHQEFGDDKYRPCPLLVKYVEAGWFGRKTGRGFYSYER